MTLINKTFWCIEHVRNVEGLLHMTLLKFFYCSVFRNKEMSMVAEGLKNLLKKWQDLKSKKGKEKKRSSIKQFNLFRASLASCFNTEAASVVAERSKILEREKRKRRSSIKQFTRFRAHLITVFQKSKAALNLFRYSSGSDLCI